MIENTEVYEVQVVADKAPFVMKHINGFHELTHFMRAVFKSGRTLSYEYRMEQLKNLQALVQENSKDLLDALWKDLRKPKMEAAAELIAFEGEVSEAIRCLGKWMAPQELPRNLLFLNDRAYIKPEPYGIVLIVGAWNYPVLLTLQPLVGAISAGNCAVIKPSEIATCSGAKIAELIPKYLDPACFQVVQGGKETTSRLLEEKFDYILSTSSTRIGHIVMKAAAENLTPVTLELGGKSPVYIHDTANLELAVKRILWGKLNNMKIQHRFVQYARTLLTEWHGASLHKSDSIGRIINLNHFNRLSQLLKQTRGKIVFGGETDSSDLWISPTLVVDVNDSDVLMQDEIFGPILPFVNAESALEAVNYLNEKASKPLALYVFTKDKKVEKLFLERTSSGGYAVNEVMLHCGWQGLPFGGVQDSGMGSYHGKYRKRLKYQTSMCLV